MPKKYRIGSGVFTPAVYVEIDGVPPCLYCGEPVERPSMDGPLVCASCDCGRNKDGTSWTSEQAKERYAHFGRMLEEYRAAQAR